VDFEFETRRVCEVKLRVITLSLSLISKEGVRSVFVSIRALFVRYFDIYPSPDSCMTLLTCIMPEKKL